MKNTILFIISAAFLFWSCTKFDNGDLSFVTSGSAPQNVSSLFDITQDNSGLVTIYPSGEGVSFYEIYFGDTTKASQKVQVGKSVQHNYPEGNYKVKVVAHNLDGKTTESTQDLTVSFRKPENFEATVAISPTNAMQVNVTASALYETLFKVYFGENQNETPVSFLEGQTVTHEYTKTGTYTVKVIALSGGAATSEYTTTISVVDPLVLPITFESSTITYGFSNFDGGEATVADNPSKTGINVSNKVGKMIKHPGQPWGGSSLGLGSAIDFSTMKYFRMKVFSPRAGAKVLLKVENALDASKNFEANAITTKSNEWEELGFDFAGINTNNTYEHIVLIFELGTQGDGSSNFTFYFDDIKQSSTLNDEVPVVKLPLTFESTTLSYNITNFDGGDLTVIDNPKKAGINTSNKVLQMIKHSGQTWGGSVISLPDPIDFSANKTFKMKVYSPRVGAKFLLKVENLTNGGINYEKEVASTKANEWEELIFDYSGINTANSYQKIVLIMDNGTAGDGTANYTFYVDDLVLN